MRILKNIGLRFDRSFSKGLFKQVLWLLAIMAIVYLLLVAMTHIKACYTPVTGVSNGRWYDVLLLLMDPGSGSDAMSSPFVVLCALLGLVVFSGMLISLISNVLGRRVENYLNGETDYKVSNHVIILGYNKSITSLLKAVHRDNKNTFIVLMCERAACDVRERIHSDVPPEVEKSVILMNGMRYAVEDIKRLCLTSNVKEIYVLGEENEEDHDTLNMKCVEMLAGMLPAGNSPVDCHVQIDSNTVFSILQSVDFKEMKLDDGATVKDRINFLPFNFNEIWSQKALATIPSQIEIGGNKEYEYFPLDGEGITSNSCRHVHLIILGMNEMAVSLAVNAAHILHFPNYREGDFSTCSCITFIDIQAESTGRHFRNRYRHLFQLSRWRHVKVDECFDDDRAWVDPWEEADFDFRHLGEKNFMDIQWEFIEGEITNDGMQAYLEKCSRHDGEITTIALCDEDSERNAESCLALSESICRCANAILVRQKQNHFIINMIRSMPYHTRMRSFGLMSECYRENLISDRFGKIINACYLGIDVSQSDLIENAWKECNVLNKWSSVYSANMLFTKLRSMGLEEGTITENHITQLMSQESIQSSLQRIEHYRWITEKLLLGFSPLTEKEQEEWNASKENQKRLRSQKKHIDIRSNQMLKDADKQKDDSVNSNLWTIYNLLKKEVVNKIR